MLKTSLLILGILLLLPLGSAELEIIIPEDSSSDGGFIINRDSGINYSTKNVNNSDFLDGLDSSAFLHADGSVSATGNIDFGGNSLYNILSVNTTQICIGADCQTSWPSGSMDYTNLALTNQSNVFNKANGTKFVISTNAPFGDNFIAMKEIPTSLGFNFPVLHGSWIGTVPVFGVQNGLYIITGSQAAGFRFYDSNVNNYAQAQYVTVSDSMAFTSASGGYTFDANVTSSKAIKGNDYYSGDGTRGYTGSCGSGTTLTVKDGLITACS